MSSRPEMPGDQLRSTRPLESSSRETLDPVVATRRGLRDLAALMALPAMWVDHEPSDIASGLLGVLFGVLHLDYAYVRFSHPGEGPTLERSRPDGLGIPTEVETALAGKSGEKESVTLTVGDLAGQPTMQITILAPGLPGEDGLVIAGSRREDFPTNLELYLLRVAAGQAAISIHTARRLETERSARVAAEQALAVRNELLGTIANELSGSLSALSESAGRARALASDPALPVQSGSSSPVETPRPQLVTQEIASQLRLTRRETEVLGLLAQGLSNKEIAALMWLSDRTVERHVTGLYRKIGVERRSEATAFAMLHGLVSPPARQA